MTVNQLVEHLKKAQKFGYGNHEVRIHGKDCEIVSNAWQGLDKKYYIIGKSVMDDYAKED